MLDSLTSRQVISETVTDAVDVVVKKKQLLHLLTQVKLLPQTDEKIRRSIKEVREYMASDQVKLVTQIKVLRYVNLLLGVVSTKV